MKNLGLKERNSGLRISGACSGACGFSVGFEWLNIFPATSVWLIAQLTSNANIQARNTSYKSAASHFHMVRHCTKF